MKSTPVCPVPTEQQPINEYQDLKESWFFKWAILDRWNYLKPILLIWFASWLGAAPVAAASFPPHKYPAQFLLMAAGGALIIPILALVRLLLGWVYVRDRLAKPEVFYEESGWYDGQVWVKPEEVLQRDRLIVTYQMSTIFQRLRYTFGAIAGLFVLGGLIWQVL
jgi:hypothetical protein